MPSVAAPKLSKVGRMPLQRRISCVAALLRRAQVEPCTTSRINNMVVKNIYIYILYVIFNGMIWNYDMEFKLLKRILNAKAVRQYPSIPLPPQAHSSPARQFATKAPGFGGSTSTHQTCHIH